MSILKRNISATNINNKPIQERGDVSLVVTENSNTSPPVTSEEDIKEIISSLINENIKDFFLFDGEQMEELTKYSQKSRQEVKKGIKTLLQLDTIEISQNSLKKYIKEVNGDIELNSSGELEIVSEQLSQAEDKISQLEINLSNCEKEYSLANQEEKSILRKIEENQEVLTKQKDRELTSLQLVKLKEEIEKLKNDLKEKLEISGAYLATPVVTELDTELQAKYDRGELPSGIRKEFIDKLLRQCRCICGNNLNDHPEAKDVLFEYQHTKTDDHSDAAIKVLRMAHDLKVRVENEDKNIERMVIQYESYQKEIESLNKKLDKYNEELKGIKGVEDYGIRLEQLKKDQSSIMSRKISDDREKKDLEMKREDLKRRQTVLSQNNQRLLKLIEQRNIVQMAIDKLSNIYEEYSDELRENLSKCATEIFKKIADSSSLQSLAKIVILDDFQLEVLSHFDTKMLSQISSGQRQIVSLSYICALLQVGSNLEMPLLMDTPFGRLSGSPRDACLKNLPQLLSQWILLTTDTEFQSEEANVLHSSDKWGAVYEIYHTDDRESQVRQEDINTWAPRRKTIELERV